MAGLLEFSNYHDNLSNNLRIAISKLIAPVHSAWVGMNNQAVILPAAAPARIGSIALENDTQRLLPHWFRATVVWFFLLSIQQRQQGARQIGVRSSRGAD